jgi:hypothetical protein
LTRFEHQDKSHDLPGISLPKRQSDGAIDHYAIRPGRDFGHHTVGFGDHTVCSKPVLAQGPPHSPSRVRNPAQCASLDLAPPVCVMLQPYPVNLITMHSDHPGPPQLNHHPAKAHFPVNDLLRSRTRHPLLPLPSLYLLHLYRHVRTHNSVTQAPILHISAVMSQCHCGVFALPPYSGI